MKKTSLLFILAISLSILFAGTLNASDQDIDTSNWYLYTNTNNFHPFTIIYPDTWHIHSETANSLSFSPKREKTSFIQMQEFNGVTNSLVLDKLQSENFSLISQEQTLLKSKYSDLITTVAAYTNPETNKSQSAYLINRGNTIVVFTIQDPQYQDILDQMLKNIKFTDQWHQYFDFQDNYTFIFPKNKPFESTTKGVNISPVFQVDKYTEPDLETLLKQLEHIDKKTQTTQDFNNIAEAYHFQHTDSESLQTVILVTPQGQFVLTYQNNSDQSLEILSSFNFFTIDIEPGYTSFLYFPDVRDSHLNARAINNLFREKIISGYPDGTFGPDQEINRAEFTKMIVGARIKPSPEIYQNCFPDVEKQWFSPYVCYAKQQNWVQGFEDGQFKPNQPITKVEALKILFEASIDPQDLNQQYLLDPKWQDIESTSWYTKYFTYADAYELFDHNYTSDSKEGKKFYPAQNITRKEVAETLYRTMQLK